MTVYSMFTSCGVTLLYSRPQVLAKEGEVHKNFTELVSVKTQENHEISSCRFSLVSSAVEFTLSLSNGGREGVLWQT